MHELRSGLQGTRTCRESRLQGASESTRHFWQRHRLRSRPPLPTKTLPHLHSAPAALRLVSRQPGDCLTSAGTSSSSEAVSGLLPQSDSDSSRTVQGSEGSGRKLSRPQPLRILVDARTAPEDFTCPDSPPSPEPDRVLEHRGSIARFCLQVQHLASLQSLQE